MEVPVVEIKEMFEGFSKDQWAIIDKRLTLFFYRHYRFEPRLEPEDLIQRAKTELCEGRRHWRPEKASLMTCLCNVMRSDASHILEKANKQGNRSLEETAETDYLKKEGLPVYLEVCDELRHLTNGDPVLSRMIEFFIKDPDMKPRHMQEQMPDVPKKEISKAYRRLNKLIDNLKKERSNGPDS